MPRKNAPDQYAPGDPGLAETTAAALGLGVSVTAYTSFRNGAMKVTEVWMVSRNGREVASWVSTTGSLRHGLVFYEVTNVEDMLRCVAQLEFNCVEVTCG